MGSPFQRRIIIQAMGPYTMLARRTNAAQYSSSNATG
jgi:hypothetical protein